MAIHNNPDVIAKFDKKWIVDSMTGCHVWIGAKNDLGYGQLRINGILVKAHRFSLAKALDKSVDDLQFVCHTCDNPSCVNPQHLFEGNAFDNARDMSNKSRGVNQEGPQTRIHCRKGHELTPDNIQMKDAKRGCLQCYKDRQARYFQSEKGKACSRKKAAKFRNKRKGAPDGISSDSY